jgi:hypothetical protein
MTHHYLEQVHDMATLNHMLYKLIETLLLGNVEFRHFDKIVELNFYFTLKLI